jgi:hypothetical protein
MCKKYVKKSFSNFKSQTGKFTKKILTPTFVIVARGRLSPAYCKNAKITTKFLIRKCVIVRKESLTINLYAEHFTTFFLHLHANKKSSTLKEIALLLSLLEVFK